MRYWYTVHADSLMEQSASRSVSQAVSHSASRSDLKYTGCNGGWKRLSRHRDFCATSALSMLIDQATKSLSGSLTVRQRTVCQTVRQTWSTWTAMVAGSACCDMKASVLSLCCACWQTEQQTVRQSVCQSGSQSDLECSECIGG